ncbi:MAG: site-2 protease family protein, partial [Saccharopolyspora rectivirgula]
TAAAGRGVVLVRADGVAVGLLDQAAAERLAKHAPHEPAERAAEPIDPDTVLLDSDSAETVLERLDAVFAWQFLVVDSSGRPCGVLRREDLRAAMRSRTGR